MTERPPGRLEDPALLRGEARFLADLPLPAGTLHAHFVRTPVPVGRLIALDVAPAAAEPGVVAAFDAASLGLDPIQHFAELPAMPQEALATERILHAGQAVALVVAHSAAEAVDAAELVEIDVEPGEALVDLTAALDGPALHPTAGSNLVLDLDPGPDRAMGPSGDPVRADLDPGPDRAAGRSGTGERTGADPGPGPGRAVAPTETGERTGADPAPTTHELVVVNQRVASMPLENDGILIVPDTEGDEPSLDVWCTLQGVHPAREAIASTFGLDLARVRVRAAAVGGGFGGRGTLLVEHLAVVAAALRLGRPVRWVGSRWENLTGMPHGRGYETRIALTVDADGRPLSLRCDALVDAGAVAHMNALLMISARRQAVGLYRIPELSWRGRAVATTTTPIAAYRGAGQPEANHARERLLDVVARRLGRDPIAYRLDHLLRPDELPRTQPGGVDYDRADPAAALRRAVERADVTAWRAEQTRRNAAGDGRRVGIGVACYAQTTGRGSPADSARVRIEVDGSVTVGCGSASHGQAHRTTLAALVADRLGVAPTAVTVVDADTEAVADGLSTGGSRSSQVLASVVVSSCDDVVAAARPLAAERLEVAIGDVVVAPASHGHDAGLAVAGVPTRRVTWAELAAIAATECDGVGTGAGPGCLEAARTESVAGASHPFGAHVTIVEVDTETGHVRFVAHTAVDDCGTVLQPAIVAGQQHGGSVAGLAQVLWEDAGFEPDGSPRGATLMTYLLPGAPDLCPIDAEARSTPTERNPLGTRGIGENGCNAALASAHNAVIDALVDLGVEHLDLPLTPERIWRAVRDGGR